MDACENLLINVNCWNPDPTLAQTPELPFLLVTGSRVNATEMSTEVIRTYSVSPTLFSITLKKHVKTASTIKDLNSYTYNRNETQQQ